MSGLLGFEKHDQGRRRGNAARGLRAIGAILALSAVLSGIRVSAATISNIATATYLDSDREYTVQSNAATTDVSGSYAIKGHVRDETGAPVQSARVNANQKTKAVASATTDATGAFAVTGLSPGVYDLVVTAPGRATAVIPGITAAPESSASSLDVRAPTLESWQQGLYMLAIPFSFTDPSPAAVLGSAAIKLARWAPDQSGGRYLLYGQDAGFPVLGPGLGFWADVDSGQLQLAQAGTPVSEQAPYAVALKPGWNMVGNPFCANVEWGAAQVRCNGQTVSLETAGQNGWVRPYGWVFDPSARQYVLLDAAYPNARRILNVWEACWVRALTACELLIAPPSGTAVSPVVLARSATGKPEWSVQLIARSGDLCDSFNYMGVDANAASDPRRNVQSPPPLSRFVDLSFSGGRAAEPDLATDFRPPSAGRIDWDFVVRTDVPNAQVALTWPDLSDVPDRYRLMLVDLDGQRRQYMRTTSSYVFNSGAEGGTRHFRIEVDPTPWARLQVNNVQQIMGRASGLTISYDVSSQATVDVEIRTLAGQLVKVLAHGVSASAGTNLITWDGADSSGRVMPNGPYLCAIAAVTEEGQAVKGMRTIILTR
jgi:hypothetical protein